MTARIAVIAIVLASILAGVGIWYLQIYAYYEEVTPDGTTDVQLTTLSGEVEPIPYEDFRAIDADSSPIRYRACFTTPQSLSRLRDTYAVFDRAEPLVAPGWFDCFDAEAIGAQLASGAAVAFLGQANVSWGVDRIVAVGPDGQGYVWHQLNACGDKAYDGTPLGENCPPRPAAE